MDLSEAASQLKLSADQCNSFAQFASGLCLDAAEMSPRTLVRRRAVSGNVLIRAISLARILLVFALSEILVFQSI
jgi:hypothetical protein